MTATTNYTLADDGSFVAPLLLAYPYARTVGPTYSRYLTGLRDGRIEGNRADDGRVFSPPAEYDPASGRLLDEWVSVGEEGTVVAWCWQPEPAESDPVDHPFAWALVRLDGADTAVLHALDAGSPDAVSTGMRVRVRWSDEREGSIRDIACLEPTHDEGGRS